MHSTYPLPKIEYPDEDGRAPIRRSPGGGIDYQYYMALGHRERSRAVQALAKDLGRAFRRLF